jgi:hypothetical protein
MVDPEDMAAAEAAFVDALGPVAYDSEAWGDESVWLDMELLAERQGLAPIAGGAPDGPYEPSEADWASYCEWSRELDASGDFPKLKDLEDRRRDREDVGHWYAEHEGGGR